MKSITLRPATVADITLLKHWETEPHVAESGVENWDWENELGDSEWREALIAEVAGRPIGFMEILDPQLEDEHYWGKDVEPNLRAIDIWIGEKDELNKGYGTEMMRQAIEKCFASAKVTAIIIDPLASNTDAHRFYERLGFKFVERRRFDDDDCFVYRLERTDWDKTKHRSATNEHE